MGFLGWFGKGRRSQVEPDSVWLTAPARIAGLCRRALGEAEKVQVVILAHFPATLAALEEGLGGRGSVARADSSAEVARWLEAPEAGTIGLALVGQLPEQGFEPSGPASGSVSFFVAERHPQRVEDDRVEELAARLPYPTSVRFHLALDDTLLDRFVGPDVKALLERLGMDEEAELSHPAISAAVERAQEKLASERPAAAEMHSAEDWFRAIEPD